MFAAANNVLWHICFNYRNRFQSRAANIQVVEAERRILINSQHENLVVRGVLRPGDVGPNNSAPATALANLEIELKGKGVVSDYIGRQNPIIRGLLWLLTW